MGKCKTGAKRMSSAKLPIGLYMRPLYRPVAPSRLPEYRHCRHITGKGVTGKQDSQYYPRWSLQNRPCVDVSKPAMESGLRQVLFYPAEVGLARRIRFWQ